MADGTITFSTSLDNTRLFKDLREAEANLNSLKKKLEGQQFEQSWLEKMMERASSKTDAAKARVEELTEKIQVLESEQSALDTDDMDPATIERWRELGDQIMSTYNRLRSAQDSYDASLAEWEGYNKKWDTATAKVESYKEMVKTAEGRQRELSEQVAKTTDTTKELTKTSSDAGATMANVMDSASTAINRLSRRIGSMVKQVVVFDLLLKGVRAIYNAVSTALMENERFSASWTRLTATVTGVANVISNLVSPALSGMVDAVSAAIESLAALVDSVLGTSFVEHIREARAAAEAAWRQGDAAQDVADATRDQADAARDLARAEDKAKRSLLGFDEINAMQAQTAEDNAEALGDEAGSVGGQGSAAKPSWDALDVGKISDKLAEIMLVLGAALMAVGAILAFSGINIPVGLTLMVIGALMIYAAYREQWDKLPEQVRQAITNTLVITGIVLLVLGAVLAFSGVNIPLGVGMMVAGAALLWTAVALNWTSMSPEMQAAVSAIMTVLSVSLMVVGAILAFSGANVPLGIALMVVGALSLGVVAAINWEALPEQMQMAITVIMAILGGAMLVIGAILAFSGANIPLGIGLMLVGAVLLGVDAALNWETIREKFDEILPLLEATLAGALLVIGMILSLSGANLPLGIALVAAGAVGLAEVLVLNWETMPEQMKGVIAIIEEVLGVAFLAIGAILTFSGANIPLGIVLMSIGAAAMGDAMGPRWEDVPEQVKEVLAIIETVVSFAFLAIGAVLTFSAANIPLGLALLAIGAVVMGSVMGPRWDAIPSEVKGTIATIEYAVGVAFLVVGAILVFSAVNIPLGLGLLAIGALSMGDAATEKWDEIPQHVKNTIAIIEAVLSAALLVIGIILCFSAVNIPLGIALVAVGALLLAHEASLDWSKMPDDVRATVTTILGILSAALIVLGIILCVTGVGIPLGIALIAAGAVSLVAAAAINWDYLPEKVREVWEAIKRFWDDNIAHVFTWEFWADVFKSIVNGLIDAINSGLWAFSDFVNWISYGIGDILNAFGVSGWSFTFNPPQIPYLAQGAVIPPNREFMAVLGDQRHGTNIEAPEALMRQVVREEAGAMMAELLVQTQGMMPGGQGGDVTLVLRVDSEELSRAVSRGNASRVRRGETGLVGMEFA